MSKASEPGRMELEVAVEFEPPKRRPSVAMPPVCSLGFSCHSGCEGRRDGGEGLVRDKLGMLSTELKA